MPRLTDERLAELRRTQHSPVEALRQHIDGPGGLRERMDEGEVTAFEVVVVMGYDALQDVITSQAAEIERLRRERETLAAAVEARRAVDHHPEDCEECMGSHSPHCATSMELGRVAREKQAAALTLLDGEKGGGGGCRQSVEG